MSFLCNGVADKWSAMVAIADIPMRRCASRRFGLGILARRATPYMLILPALLVLGVFIYWPIVYSAWLSIHKWRMMAPAPDLVWLDNYDNLLSSTEFANSLAVTCLFVLVSVPLRLGLALFLAQMLVTETRFNRWVRGALFVPAVSSSVAVAIIWSWLFNTDLGLINGAMSAVGFARQSWLYDPDLALWSVAAVAIWKQLGYDVLLYAAGLQAIPAPYYEAARVDGAGRWAQFRRITLPLVMPTTFFLLVVSVIDSFQVFTLVNVMTKGGPAWSTDVLINLLYRKSFIALDLGTGSALAMLLFVFLIGLTAVKFAVIGRKVNYDRS